MLLMLTENRQWTIDMMCERLGLQRRNIYYYLEFFKQAEFGVKKRNGYYYISRQSPFISKLCDVVKFSDAEAITIRRMLDASDSKDPLVQSIKNKLERFYDFNIIEKTLLNKEQAKMVQKIYEAIASERMIIIHDYSSPHSSSVMNRIVEPFLLMNGNRDLRAYEQSSKMNKTFRISRMGRIELTDKPWENRNKHRQMFTDYFNFSGEQPQEVTLRLDQLSYNVLMEEYPQAERDITPDEDGRHWTFRASVCSMIGIGRFVLGLFDHIEIINSPELTKYIQEKLNAFTALAKDKEL